MSRRVVSEDVSLLCLLTKRSIWKENDLCLVWSQLREVVKLQNETATACSLRTQCTISLTDASNLKFVRLYATFTFTVLLPMTVHYQQMAICLCYSELKLVCRALLYAEWGFYSWGRRDEDMQKCREDGQKKALKEGERLRGKKGGRQGCWLVKRFAFTTCYAFCPCETIPFGVLTHHPQCLVSLRPPVTPYVRSASILHKG